MRDALARADGDHRGVGAARRERLGYAPGRIDPAIVDALAWFREQGMLPA
ncbi:MAG: hypothetical protein H0T76_28650 [Nannocystis sp.]|nr:hypothetical protein [Nannocystis sp.]MBA3550464.1 hypothetical protein [Nannocystis sp.]